MNNKRTTWLGILVATILIVSMLATFGCGSKTTPATSAPAPAASAPAPAPSTSAPAPAPATSAPVPAPSASAPAPAPSASAVPATDTLKIGLVCNFGWTLGISMIQCTRVLAEMDNAAGGWDVGGKKYKLQFIEYDTQNNQNTETAAVNKLVFEDKVKFIMFDNNLADAALPITEANKVIALEETPTPPACLPTNHYSFAPAMINCQYAVLPQYFSQTFPKAKTLAAALPDNQVGHAVAGMIVNNFGLYGITATAIYYPGTATDLSALGTKVKSVNPDLFTGESGGPLCYKAVYDAGYRGQLIGIDPAPFENDRLTIGAAPLEGKINAAWPVEFDPALTPLAQTFKAAYIKKYGSWDGPEIQCTSEFYCLKAALAKAGTLDTDKVTQVIGSGLQFEALNGTCSMAARPDLGNIRTVDSVVAYYMKKIVNGKITNFATINISDAVAAFGKAFPAK